MTAALPECRCGWCPVGWPQTAQNFRCRSQFALAVCGQAQPRSSYAAQRVVQQCRHEARRSTSLTPGFQDRGLVPVIGRHGHAPDVSWLIKFDPAVQRVLRIDIDNPSRSTLVRQVDVNRDSHSIAQPNRGCDQCSVKVDDDGLAVARPALSAILNRDNHLQRDTSTSSGLMKCLCRGHE